MSAKDLLVGDTKRGQPPLVSLGIHPATKLFTVNCAACGDCVQHTGEGGYMTAETASIEAQTHRFTHLTALMAETADADPNISGEVLRAILSGLEQNPRAS